MDYEEVEHTADWALRVRGATLAELLVNAANGLMKLAGVELEPRRGSRRKLEISSLDRESLLVDFLQELVLALELRSAGFQQMQIETDDIQSLWGSVREVPVKRLAKPVKAVTYNELQIERSRNGYAATVVFDV